MTSIIATLSSSAVTADKSSNSLKSNRGIINSPDQAKPLDNVASSEVAANIASLAGLEESTAVKNYADSERTELAVPAADGVTVNKPQIVATNLKSKKDIKNYTAVEGDTISSVATKFGITADTVKHSNGLSAESIPAGKALTISPVNGMVYTVQTGDTPDSLTAKYQANKENLIAFNDAEINGGFKPGEVIVIPDAVQPQAPASLSRSTSIASNSSSGASLSFGSRPQYGGNGYDYGYCTWYVANRRPVPTNWGNANTWDEGARASGMAVSRTPIPGSILQDDGRLYGTFHVAYVEEVYADGSIKVSEMNVKGWNKLSSQIWSADAYTRAQIDFIY